MGKRSTDLATRINNSTDQSGECWLWQLAVNNRGYGRMRTLDRKMSLAHRVSYETHVGPIPEGMVIDHTCRVRLCVNPAHLQLATRGTNAENLDVTPESNRTGHLNVYKQTYASGYVVIVRANGKRHYGGSHGTIEEAAEAARDLRNRVKTNNLQDRI